MTSFPSAGRIAHSDGWRAPAFTADGVVQSRRNNDLAKRFQRSSPQHAAWETSLSTASWWHHARTARTSFHSPPCPPAAPLPGERLLQRLLHRLRPARRRQRGPAKQGIRRSTCSPRAGFTQAAPPLQLTPSTPEREITEQWMQPEIAFGLATELRLEFAVVVSDVCRPSSSRTYLALTSTNALNISADVNRSRRIRLSKLQAA